MQKIYIFLCLFFTTFLSFGSTFAASGSGNTPIEFSVFTRPDCIHCIELKAWLDETYTSGSQIQPRYYDINIPENARLYEAFTKDNNLSRITPILLVGNEIIEGF